jgi:glycosyltransferase involved in cell wall biosynthesis
MRVTLCIDALDPQPGGIGRYTWELCKGLAGRDDVDVRYFGRGRLIDDPAKLQRGEPVFRGKGLVRFARRWKARREMRSSVVHGPNYFLPPAAPRGVITVHDLSVLRYPETHPAERVRAFERQFASSLERTAHIITDTETVRGEVIEAFSIPADKISAVPLGVDERFRPLTELARTGALENWGLTAGSYGLCVSTLEPRKKVAELLSAWRRLPGPLRGGFPLVLAGGRGWLNDDLRHEVESAASEGWLRPMGFVDEALLPELYAGAGLFLYPSIYEGFGLPPLEAMASGVPVVVSNRSCLPEVCGDAARYVEPDDTDGFASAIEESFSDAQWRQETALRGLERARRFTWAGCVDGTVSVYRRVTEKA